MSQKDLVLNVLIAIDADFWPNVPRWSSRERRCDQLRLGADLEILRRATRLSLIESS